MPPRHGTTAVVVSCPPSLQQLTTPTGNDFTLGAAVSSGTRIPKWSSTAYETTNHSERRQGAAVIHAGRTSMLLEHVFSKAFISGVDARCLNHPPPQLSRPSLSAHCPWSGAQQSTASRCAGPVPKSAASMMPAGDNMKEREIATVCLSLGSPLARVVSHAVTAVVRPDQHPKQSPDLFASDPAKAPGLDYGTAGLSGRFGGFHRSFGLGPSRQSWLSTTGGYPL
ncbi:uncharacterized protein CCOS01_09867 [Colletotrichum costaricense]|uniref:Uncharacterized protein n=1 Tax=Colletotrichum costaricense TaxID=1209916 RepID=A0AAI9YSN6_9PEZI|nr:uncharacterized protein CCOS01_09867 [Colletotrichum costaricense]KAK1522155.1 hypothetical protein CCOS01_09867 [Colletotrichum costaricense]